MVKSIKTIRLEVEEALKQLATAKFDEDLYFHYLFFVEDIMNLYQDFVKASNSNDYNEYSQIGSQIVFLINSKYDDGFLKED